VVEFSWCFRAFRRERTTRFILIGIWLGERDLVRSSGVPCLCRLAPRGKGELKWQLNGEVLQRRRGPYQRQGVFGTPQRRSTELEVGLGLFDGPKVAACPRALAIWQCCQGCERFPARVSHQAGPMDGLVLPHPNVPARPSASCPRKYVVGWAGAASLAASIIVSLSIRRGLTMTWRW